MSEEEEKKEITTWNPEEIFRTYDEMFRDFRRNLIRSWNNWPLSEPGYWSRSVIPWVAQKPPVDLIDNGDSFKLVAEVPGFNKDNIEIEVTEDDITIRGKTEESKQAEEKNYRVQERRYSSFRRSMRFPEKVKPKLSSAKLEHGVLEVTVPKETPTEITGKHKVPIE